MKAVSFKLTEGELEKLQNRATDERKTVSFLVREIVNKDVTNYNILNTLKNIESGIIELKKAEIPKGLRRIYYFSQRINIAIEEFAKKRMLNPQLFDKFIESIELRIKDIKGGH